MSIILQKPEFFRKNEDNNLIVSRAAIRSIPMVSSHFYFRKVKNWKHIVFNYASVPANQIEVVVFDGTQEEPSGVLKVSPRARNEFVIDSVVLYDFDLGWLTIPRSELPDGDLDFIFDSRFWQPDLSISIQNKSDAVLTWTQAEGTDSQTVYTVYKKTGAGEFVQLTTVTGNLAYTDQAGLAPDVTYEYRVTIEDFEKYLPQNESQTVMSARPPVPTGLTGTTTPGQVTLNWNPVVGSNISYRVYRSTSPNNPNPSLIFSNLVGTSYTDNTVTNGVNYYYKVASYDGFESLRSGDFVISPLGDFAITSFAPTSATSASISWSAAAGANSYSLFYKKIGDATYTQINNVSSPYNLTGLSEGTNYQAYLRAANSFATYNTNTSNATTPFAPTVPTALTAESWQDSKSDLSWSPSANADRYFIYSSPTQNGTYVKIGEVNHPTTSYSSVNLTNGTTYWYKVSSINDHDNLIIESSKSAEVSAVPNKIEALLSWSAGGHTASSSQYTFNGWTLAPGYLISKIVMSLYSSTAALQWEIESNSGETSLLREPYSVANNTQMSVVVKIHTTRGEVFSGISFFRTQANAPTNFSIAENSSLLDLSWSAGAGNNSYKLYRSNSSNMSLGTEIRETSSTSTTYTPPFDTTYHYAVKGLNSSPWSGALPSGFSYDSSKFWHEPSQFSPSGSATVYTPTQRGEWYIISGVNYQQGLGEVNPSPSSGTVNLRFLIKEPSVQTIRLYRSTSLNGTYTLIDTINNPSLLQWGAGSADFNKWKYFDKPYSGLTNGQDYFYRYDFINTPGATSPMSHRVRVRPLEDSGAKVVEVLDRTATTVKLSWPETPGASYDAGYSTSPSGPFGGDFTIESSTSGTATGLTVNTQYYFRVKAYVSNLVYDQNGQAPTGLGVSMPPESFREYPVITATPVITLVRDFMSPSSYQTGEAGAWYTISSGILNMKICGGGSSPNNATNATYTRNLRIADGKFLSNQTYRVSIYFIDIASFGTPRHLTDCWLEFDLGGTVVTRTVQQIAAETSAPNNRFSRNGAAYTTYTPLIVDLPAFNSSSPSNNDITFKIRPRINSNDSNDVTYFDIVAITID